MEHPVTDYPTTIEHYGPNGLISTEVVHNVLTGEAELAHLSPDRIRQAYTTLRTWSADAAQSNTDWPTLTAGQKDATMRETIRRLGIFLDRFADILLLDGRT
jgi:hypothetical protein